MWFSLLLYIVLLNRMRVVNPVTVATTICCHGCQSWALVSENGGWACQTPFKPQAGIFFLYKVKLCAIVEYVSVYKSRGAFRGICIIHCTLIMDQFLLFLCQTVSLNVSLTPLCIETTEEHYSLLSADSTALSGYCYSQHFYQLLCFQSVHT